VLMDTFGATGGTFYMRPCSVEIAAGFFFIDMRCGASRQVQGQLHNLCPAVVMVGVYCQERQTHVRMGAGFIVNPKRGLIVTAMHVLYDMEGDLGKLCCLRKARVVIGLIPQAPETKFLQNN
jgi:S1-C subfamily serine protease